jgi:hypothetical protein
MEITFQIDTYDSDDPQLRDVDDVSVARAVAALMESLIAIDMDWLQRNGAAPLYRSGVVYCCATGPERFADIGRVLDCGGGDCAELSAWRIAELRLCGESRAKAILDISRDRETTMYHVLVLRGNGRREDPSIILGME